jgi:hypothetical protein
MAIRRGKRRYRRGHDLMAVLVSAVEALGRGLGTPSDDTAFRTSDREVACSGWSLTVLVFVGA